VSEEDPENVVSIVGGGLAGLGLAHGLLRRGVPVRVWEAGTYPRHRVCGEFFCGLDEETLAVLGLEEVFAPAPRHRSTCWYRGGKLILRRDLPADTMGLSRFHLDAELAARVAKAGGDLRTGRRVDASRLAGAVVSSAGRRVAADSPWVGLKGHYRSLETRAGLEVHLGAGAYVGVTEVEDGRVNVCGLFPKAMAAGARGLAGEERMALVLRRCGMRDLAGRLEESLPDADSFSACAGFRLGIGRGDNGAVPSLGDHWGVIPPFTGNGMTMALQSAALAVPVVANWHAGAMDWPEAVVEIKQIMRRKFLRRMRWAGVLHPALLNRSGQSMVGWLAGSGLLPFRALFGLTH